ncbi:hypothetical protein [Robertkochia aurantiaca]|uniref:hypothetical protein n=1 Tax=Robertkochia aurantiaca TaxID=2873700 RepID=UPI001CCE893B|nr:hypothetical protein [Robertkochia sp. 3YJGBD-33]
MHLKLNTNTKRAIGGGVVGLMVIIVATYLLGELSGYEAKVLIKQSLTGLNTLSNTIVLASATILALLLTALGLSSSTETRLKDAHYADILIIAKTDTGVFIAALFVFLVFNIPITEADNVPPKWYSWIYYGSITISSILSAALIVVVLMLYNTVTNIIKIVGLNKKDHPLTYEEMNEEEEEESSDK